MIGLSFGLIFLQAQATAQTWTQWGGPQRNFMTEAKGLAESWPAAGPKRLWSRELGEGHSSVVAEAGRLYTMYSRGEQEFVVALEAATGKTLWYAQSKSFAAFVAFRNEDFDLQGNGSPELYTGVYRHRGLLRCAGRMIIILNCPLGIGKVNPRRSVGR